MEKHYTTTSREKFELIPVTMAIYLNGGNVLSTKCSVCIVYCWIATVAAQLWNPIDDDHE